MVANSVWSAPVRFAEVDRQGVVFNAHYLTYCDEALAAFLAEQSSPTLDLLALSAELRLVTSTLTWRQAARWGDVIDVGVSCVHIGRTSLTMSFAVQVGEQACCEVTTVYVHVDEQGRPLTVPDAARVALAAAENTQGNAPSLRETPRAAASTAGT